MPFGFGYEPNDQKSDPDNWLLEFIQSPAAQNLLHIALFYFVAGAAFMAGALGVQRLFNRDWRLRDLMRVLDQVFLALGTGLVVGASRFAHLSFILARGSFTF